MPTPITGHRGVNHYKVSAKSIKDGLDHDLFVIENVPIYQESHLLGIFKTKKIVGYEKTLSELRTTALEKLKQLKAEKKNEYSVFRILEISDCFDSVVGTAWSQKIVWSDLHSLDGNGSWL